ncbi:BrnT family toxin [Azospirillum brasilense]|uniref:BrnT family toxin n=1 Tax=Azospirillum argentinense TaxID=2970906 RepID=UPI00190EDB5F|nr:BrnT family toxin [Azospirillum argentinense]MBK3804371.1 BrnT family toxin [Azospirillum argentinense]
MDFEWDESKRLSNIAKHGIDFEDAMYIWDGTVIEKSDPRDYGGEKRFNSFGELDGRLLAVVHTWRGNTCRLISARKANDREQRAYHAALSSVAPEPDD